MSVPNIVGCIGAAIIIIAAIATPIAKSQHMREIWFYVMSGGVMLKIVVMEIARIVQMLTLYVKDLKMKAFERTKTWLQAKNIYNFILEQLSDLEEIHYRAMMGEYLTGLFNAMYDELPVHKSNNKRNL